jgi:hypothetical protein
LPPFCVGKPSGAFVTSTARDAGVKRKRARKVTPSVIKLRVSASGITVFAF